MMGTKLDGRYVDPALGVLEGEGSHQEVSSAKTLAAGHDNDTWKSVPSIYQGAHAAEPTYYDKPVIKPPVWIWSIPAYFYVGGATGAAMLLGAAAQVWGDHRLRRFVTRCRWTGTVGGSLSAALLISDLGRKKRFLNMLRVFRPTSPMSVGSWILASATPLSGAAALLANARGPLRLIGDCAGCTAGILGMPLAGYTAVLISNSAVPVWQSSRRSLPWLFIGSAMVSAASALEIMRLNRREEKIIDTFAIAGGAVELVSCFALEREAGQVKRVGAALYDGVPGALWRAGKMFAIGSLIVSALPGRSRRKRFASGAMGTLAALCFKFAVFQAGKRSAADPRATFRQQRAGYGAAEVTGQGNRARAIAGPHEQRAG